MMVLLYKVFLSSYYILLVSCDIPLNWHQEFGSKYTNMVSLSYKVLMVSYEVFLSDYYVLSFLYQYFVFAMNIW